MKIGGILENSNLAFYRIIIKKDQPGAAGSILKFYAQRKINLEYITESGTENGSAVMAICIKDSFVPEVDKFVLENQDKIKDLQIIKTENVSTLGIYGPHFREKHSIAARFCMLLGTAGVDIFGISSSISSVCCVIKTSQLETGRASILKYFELP